MKITLLPILMIILSGTILGEEPLKFATINTNAGKTYTGVTVREVTPSQIKIFHEAGISTIAMEDLPEDIQKTLNYDPAKAAEHATAHAAAEEARAAAEEQRRQAAWLRLPSNKRYTIQPARGNGITLRYEDFHTLTQEEQSKAKTQQVSDEVLRSRISSLPQGGKITVKIERHTIGAANSEYCLVIVSDLNGKEILRRRGSNDIAETPIDPGGMWWNLVLVDLPKPIGAGIKIRVADTLDDTHADFTIRPTK